MQIVCPNCSTSYAIDPAQIGPAGRSVRCSRCKDTWHVTSADVLPAFEMAGGNGHHTGRGHTDDHDTWHHDDTPAIDSPSISVARNEDAVSGFASRFGSRTGLTQRLQAGRSALAGRLAFLPQLPRPPKLSLPAIMRPYLTLRAGCVAMAALVIGLVVWRADMVRLMPQTASFFKTVGFEVNLRGLRIENVTITPEDIDGKPGYVIDGVVTTAANKPAQLPRLRFIVHDGHGAEIYAWTSVPEQKVVQPGERIPFRSRLAAPPPDAREIAVRFFNKRDIGA